MDADFIKEIAIMTALVDHPNVCHVHEVFEDSDNYYLVMELCGGGELFDAIIAKASSLAIVSHCAKSVSCPSKTSQL